MLREFVIPLNKDELLQSHAGQYFVEEVVPLRILPQTLDSSKQAQANDGPFFILDHFDAFFALIVHGNKVELSHVFRCFNRIFKAVQSLVNDLEACFNSGTELEDVQRQKLLCVNKMLAYLFSSLTCQLDERVIKENNDADGGSKRKKAPKKSDAREQWDEMKQSTLEIIYRWIQLPLHKLWNPPIVEDSFIITFAQICYKTLEYNKDSKEKNEKYVRQTIFEILGVLIKKYNHGMICVVRIIQLVKLYDSLVAHLAAGVVYMVENCNCTGFVKEVVKEIEQSEPEEIENRNISSFLENIAESNPNVMIPLINYIVDYLAHESYLMRNCALTILGVVVEKALTSEELTREQKEIRDECLSNLEEHILDHHAYVRSKVLQIWQRLCCEAAIPMARQGKLLAATTLRMEDKSAIVRKQALQLLRALLQSNPYAAKLHKTEIQKELEKEEAALKELQIDIVRDSAKGDEERVKLWKALFPNIQKALKKMVSKDEEQEEDEDENSSSDQDENDDPQQAFEKIRQLMLEEKVHAAVSCLWKVAAKLNLGETNFKNMADNQKEECLYLFLLKIFMELEINPATMDQNGTSAEPESQELREKKGQMKTKSVVVDYLRRCLEFAQELEKAIPIAENLLFSTTVGDAVEACSFLGIAYQFGAAGSETAINKALLQVWNSDISVRNNLAAVYKDIYFKEKGPQSSDRQRAFVCVDGLVKLCKQLEPGQSQALTQLIVTWYNNKELGDEVLQVLWERFSMKLPETTELDSRAALMLITMVAQAEPNIIIRNLEVLVKVGLGQRATADLLLARDTCRALLKIKQDKSDIKKPPIRYPNDHDIFKNVVALLVKNFADTKNSDYVSFATDAINVIFHLANKPDLLSHNFLLDIWKEHCYQTNDSGKLTYSLLARLLHLIGHISIRQMVHLDTSVYRELKRRNALRELKKQKTSTNSNNRKSFNMTETPTSAGQILRIRESTNNVQEDNGEAALEGAADDADAEYIHAVLEDEIVNGNGFLSAFVPVVLEVCQHPEKYDDENLHAAAVLALSKMMTVSSKFCEESLQLLVTILERSPYPHIRSTVLIGMSDLTTRFPNQVEPWTKHIYGRLRDPDVNVKRTCVKMLSSLIMREMVRVKGQVSELALCIVDEDNQIRQETRNFFKNISQKGNSLYNVLPDILSRLSDPSSKLDEAEFQEITKYILALVQKERQVDTMIEKLCARFKLASSERQWCDLSYCLSLLQFNGKSIRRLIESLPFLKDKIHHKQVYKALQSIIDQTKKKPEAKASCLELEEKIKEMLESTEGGEKAPTDAEAMPPPATLPPPRRKKQRQRNARRRSSSEEEEEDDSDSSNDAGPSKTPEARSKRKPNPTIDSDSEEEVEATGKKTPGRSNARRQNKTRVAQLVAESSPVPKKTRSISSNTPDRSKTRRSSRTSVTPKKRTTRQSK